MTGKDNGDWGGVTIGEYQEVGIKVGGKGNYEAWSYSGGEILQRTKDENGINTLI